MISVGIKYCGGCNPRYDRSRMVTELIKEFPGISFIYDTSVYCPLWITVNGCPVACGADAELPAKEVIRLTQPKDFFQLRTRLQALCTDASSSRIQHCSVGDTATLQKTFTFSDTAAFSRLTGDTNEIHIPSAVASQGLFHRPIVQGILVSSLLSALMGTRLPGSGTILLEEHVEYLRPVFPGDTVTAEICFREYTEHKNFYTGTFTGTCTLEGGSLAVSATYRQMMSKHFFTVRPNPPQQEM